MEEVRVNVNHVGEKQSNSKSYSCSCATFSKFFSYCR